MMTMMTMMVFREPEQGAGPGEPGAPGQGEHHPVPEAGDPETPARLGGGPGQQSAGQLQEAEEGEKRGDPAELQHRRQQLVSR